MAENGLNEKIIFRLDDWTFDKVIEECNKKQISISQFMRNLVEDYFKERGSSRVLDV